jgi:RNA polymerase sigma-70 factor (ECF subfamily)
MDSRSGDVTQLLVQFQKGNEAAKNRLVELLYQELHRLAAGLMRHERVDHTLQPTALVNEAYIQLIDQKADWQSRAHFIGIAAQVMRRILVDHARADKAEKRGGFHSYASLHSQLQMNDIGQVVSISMEDVLLLDQALERLEQFAPRESRVVELRFFGGLSVDETAGLLGVNSRTVQRDWRSARAWLHKQIRPGA